MMKLKKVAIKRKENKEKDYFERHPVQKWFAIILACILAFVAAMAITLFVLKKGKGKDVDLPDFSEMTLEEAQKAAEEAHLKLEIEEDYDMEIEEGKVIKQEPPYQANFKVKEKSTVKLVISKGQEMVEMIKVVGMKRDEAMNALKDIGLIADIEDEYSDKVEKDVVIEQEVKEKEEVLKGSKVKIKVSAGIEQVEVPDLYKMTEDEAKSAITAAKLKWKSTTKISDSSKSNGVVVDQSISSGSRVDKDTEITITVNEFDELKNGTIKVDLKSIFNYTQKYDDEGKAIQPEKVQIVLLFDGEDGAYDTADRTEADSEVTFKVKTTGSKNGKVQIKKGGSVYKQIPFTFNSGDNISI